ncbi:two-component sensor histidine kinase [Cereibacter changlensis]|nr:two-component sensor histidine kinase [Cereibacter changlensis]
MDAATHELLENVDATEADHRIANHMAMLSGYVRLKVGELSAMPDAPEKITTLRLVESIGAQIAAVAELHRMLTARSRLHSGDIGAQLSSICDAFRAGPACKALISYDGDPDCLLPVHKVLPVSQIVSEMVTNALKYGHRAGLVGMVKVSCRKMPDDGGLLISVEDNGNGLPDVTAGAGSDPLAGGVGVQLVRALARQVGGAISYDSSPDGLTFRLLVEA